MINEIRRASRGNEHLLSSQQELQEQVKKTFKLSIDQGTISNILKMSVKYGLEEMKSSNIKRHKLIKYPDQLEKVLYE